MSQTKENGVVRSVLQCRINGGISDFHLVAMNVTSAQVAYIDNHRSDKVVRRYSAYVITPLWLSCGDKAERGSAMLAKSFLEEVEADMHKGEPVWRETGDGHGRVYSLRT